MLTSLEAQLRWKTKIIKSYLQPHDQRQVLVLGLYTVSIIEPPKHVGPVSHLHIVPGFFAPQSRGEPCAEFNHIHFVNLVFGYSVTVLHRHSTRNNKPVCDERSKRYFRFEVKVGGKKTREEVCKSLVHSTDILPSDSTTLSKKHKVKSTRKEPIVKVSSCKGSA